LELAQAGIATQSPPKTARRVLGVAFYRTSQWKSAVNELERYVQETSDVAAAGYFLAMACWQLDRKDDARDWYNKALMRMQTNAKEEAELIQFQAEAKELIELGESASTQTPR
jgi:Flp pilus assembly protein TadD